MKTTTIRFGEDLWAMLDHEARLAGVSVSQYVREAALARATAAAAARGIGPFEHLAAGFRETLPSEDPARGEAERALAVLARLTNRERSAESDALRSESRQAVRKTRALLAERRRQS